MIRKQIYKWHRVISLIIAIPVLLWAASGFMHPIMTNIKPQVATRFIRTIPVDSSKIKVTLQKALDENHIDSITNFRLVHIEKNWFYQIQQAEKEPIYISTQTGKLLPKGEWLYAQYLARTFLEGQKESSSLDSSMESIAEPEHDCCNAAANCVLKNIKGAKVTDVSTLNSFDSEYKSINKLLPVHRVSFNRADGVRIYVETTQDRFAFAMDNKRAIFDTVFQWFHTWSFLDFLGKGKLWLEIFVCILALMSTSMGLYIFFTTKSKNVKGNDTVKKRRNHRYTALVASLFTLMFAFSGAYHAFSKLDENRPSITSNQNWFATKNIQFNFDSLLLTVKKPISNISLVKMNNQVYWQINLKSKQEKKGSTASMNKQQDAKKMQVPPPSSLYINCNDYSILPNGEVEYAKYLASVFSKNSTNNITKIDTILKFEGEYGFANKRLPVFKISYATNSNERYYVETATGKLAVRIDDKEVVEGYSFSFLHKHHFLDFAGKGWRDFSTMFWAAMQIVMVLIGLILYFHTRKKRK